MDPLEIESPYRVLHDNVRHLFYVLLFKDRLESLRKLRCDERNRGNASLFDVELVNYQP